MNTGKDFSEKIKKNELYHRAYECIHCGACANIWPKEHRCSLATRYQGTEANCMGLNWILQDIIEDKLFFSPGLVDLVFRCTTCNQCVINCAASLEPRVYVEALRKDLVEEGAVPKTVMEVFVSMGGGFRDKDCC
jgi:succinate dehydrogenase/fumarate reductase-like Fe-S protein